MYYQVLNIKYFINYNMNKKIMVKNGWVEEGENVNIFNPNSTIFLPVDLFFVDSKYMFSDLSYYTIDCQYLILMFILFINQKEKIGQHSLIQVQGK